MVHHFSIVTGQTDTLDQDSGVKPIVLMGHDTQLQSVIRPHSIVMKIRSET